MHFCFGLLIAIALASCAGSPKRTGDGGAKPSMMPKHRVFITTDLNTDGGDPDDQQSMAHVLLYANELDIKGIAPDAWGRGGVAEINFILSLYDSDRLDPANTFSSRDFPPADLLRARIAQSPEAAVAALIAEARRPDARPLYVLAWGLLGTVHDALMQAPDIAPKLRLLSIGTFKKYEASDGNEPNWNNLNSWRDPIFAAFPQLWWLESDWTYAGMFDGHPELSPETLNTQLRRAGRLGQYIHSRHTQWDKRRYFRAGDTPTVLYLIDPAHDPDDPTRSSWAGRFVRPFPAERPNYFIGVAGESEWNFADPSQTWANKEAVFAARKQTLSEGYLDMGTKLLARVDGLYKQADGPNRQPAATPDRFTLAGGAQRRFNATDGVLVNDADPDGHALSAWLETPPQHGKFQLCTTGGFRYTPDAQFVGTDRFTYRATDGLLASQPVEVVITVTAP